MGGLQIYGSTPPRLTQTGGGYFRNSGNPGFPGARPSRGQMEVRGGGVASRRGRVRASRRGRPSRWQGGSGGAARPPGAGAPTEVAARRSPFFGGAPLSFGLPKAEDSRRFLGSLSGLWASATRCRRTDIALGGSCGQPTCHAECLPRSAIFFFWLPFLLGWGGASRPPLPCPPAVHSTIADFQIIPL